MEWENKEEFQNCLKGIRDLGANEIAGVAGRMSE